MYKPTQQESRIKRWLIPALTAALLPITETATAQEELVVYSSRKEQLIKPLFDAFEKESGIHVTYQTGKEGPLIERLKQELPLYLD